MDAIIITTNEGLDPKYLLFAYVPDQENFEYFFSVDKSKYKDQPAERVEKIEQKLLETPKRTKKEESSLEGLFKPFFACCGQ